MYITSAVCFCFCGFAVLTVLHHAGTCNLAADPTPPVTADQCSAAAFNWLGDSSKAALAYNYTAPSCNYASKDDLSVHF